MSIRSSITAAAVRPRLAVAALCVCLGMAPGCTGDGPIVPAVGSYSDVAILTDLRTMEPVAREVARALAVEVVYALQPETTFTADIFDMKDRKTATSYKNVVVIGRLKGRDSASKELARELGGETLKGFENRSLYVAVKEDVYAKNQYVLFLAGTDRNLMQSAVRRSGDRIRNEIGLHNRQRLREFLLGEGRNVEAERRLAAEAPFRLEVPKGFKETRWEIGADRGVVEFAATGPTRSVAVFYERVDDAAIVEDQGRLAQMRLSWGRDFLEEEVQLRGLQWGRGLLGEQELPTMEGNWRALEGVFGGPFRTFVYFDEESSLLYGINLLAYAPGMPKHGFLREVHAVAETFVSLP